VSVQVSPDSRGTPRPTGTGNVTAMFTRGYIEALFKTADTPLGRELDSAMARYPGIHLIAFGVADAAKAHHRLAEAGFRMRPLVELQRPVETAQGVGTAAFTVARVESGEMPEGRIQMLTHHTEDTVWQKRWLTHPNGALGLASVMIVVTDLDEAAERFTRFTGRKAQRSPLGQTIALDRGRVDLVSPEGLAQAVPGIAIPSLPFIGAYGIKVKSLGALETILAQGGVRTRPYDDGLLAPFPEQLGQGAWLFTK
jgi:catechol 2,3-dioxygenase-like lactoylglutathione lyase family enzyme